ncbi:MAG: HAD family hydrolase [Thermomicrobiaceae bacterium]
MKTLKARSMQGLILFDIDGTLLRPGDLAHQQSLVDSVRAVYGIEPSLEGVPLGGMLDSQIVRLALEKYQVPAGDIGDGLPSVMEQMGRRYLELLGDDDRRSWLLPGVDELLARTAPGFTLGVLTGNASGVARAKLMAAGIDHYFSFGAFGDSADHRHELVPVAIEQAEQKLGTVHQAGDVVIVGDTPRDIEAARESGASVIAVATGRYPVEELSQLDPDLVLSDLSEVENVYQALAKLTAR